MCGPAKTSVWDTIKNKDLLLVLKHLPGGRDRPHHISAEVEHHEPSTSHL